ncbi:hypothetical protein [Streptomyces sp. NPDC048106]|uniref:hypothetical protein n=1 Tax=Streptomyces sp. NPDC048106 TaxID=3155750 RepID=UPI0034564404
MDLAGHRLPETSLWDWEVIGWDAGALRLAAGYDLTYHHILEAVFVAPVFVSCPFSFQDPVFRAPAPDETARLVRFLGETPPVVVAFEADAGGCEPVSCLIAAERVEIRQGPVRRGTRERDHEAPGDPPDPPLRNPPGPPAPGTPRWPGVPLATD